MDLGLEVVGLEAITDFVKQCSKNENKLVRKATTAGARLILRAAKDACPESADGNYDHPKGNLKKSLKAKVLKQKITGKQLVLIGPEVGKKAKNDGWYGRLVENGTSKMAPHPFLRPAYDETKNAALNEAAKVYGENWGQKNIADISAVGDMILDTLT